MTPAEKSDWFCAFVQVECTTLTPYEVLDASGHVALFADKMVKDPGSGECFRADKLLEDRVEILLKKDPMMPTAQREQLQRIARQADAWSLEELHKYFGELGIKCAWLLSLAGVALRCCEARVWF
jgi:glycyl-tRNA synthetase